jgi:hypothetical protein
MNQDSNTTAIDSSNLPTKNKTGLTGGSSITSGKINPIVDKKELDLVSGGMKEAWIQVWAEAWVRIAF